MGWLTNDNDGKNFETTVKEACSGLLWLLACLLFVYGGALLWLVFSDKIKAALLTAQNAIF